MNRSKRGRGRGGLTGTEQAAIAARQAGLLDAYTEVPGSAALSDSDKFKEGYKKKSKTKDKKARGASESEETPKEPEPETPQVAASWDEVVESWEDIDAPEMPVPPKVKQEQRKLEKQRKKQQNNDQKGQSVDDAKQTSSSAGSKDVAAVTAQVAAVKLDDSGKNGAASPSNSNSKAKQSEPSGAKNAATGSGAPGDDHKKTSEMSAEEQAAVKAEREAKKAAKAAAKAAALQKKKGVAQETNTAASSNSTPSEAKPAAADTVNDAKPSANNQTAAEPPSADPAAGGGGGKSKAELKAERRAKQEAQRAAKLAAKTTAENPAAAGKKTGEGGDNQKPGSAKKEAADDNSAQKSGKSGPSKSSSKTAVNESKSSSKDSSRLVPLFSHLRQYEKANLYSSSTLPVVGGAVHSAIMELGLQILDGKVYCSEDKCSRLLRALHRVICDQLSSCKDPDSLSKVLEDAVTRNVSFLVDRVCPLTISMANGVKYVKSKLKNFSRSNSDEENKSESLSMVERYIKENIVLAAEEIASTGSKRIADGDVILTYSDSGLIEKLLLEAAAGSSGDAKPAAAKAKRFKVIVADDRLYSRGKRLAAKLANAGIETTYILLTAVSQVLPYVDKVFLGCDGLMANGCVVGPVGTSQVALLAKSAHIPVIVVCETYKFTGRVQTDSFVENELSDPEALTQPAYSAGSSSNCVSSHLKDWRSQERLYLLNLRYDVTPANLLEAVITEMNSASVIPTTSVPVVLRLKNIDAPLL